MAFDAGNTALHRTGICLLYIYKYREPIPDMDRLQVKDVAGLWE